MYNKEVAKQKKINKHEQKTRYTATQLITDLFFSHLLTIQQTPVKCHVDVRFTADSHTYDVEVKTRNKDVGKYPYLELKHSKLENMKLDHHNNNLIYVVINNDSVAYFFNLSKLDWSKIETFMWRIKKVQYLEDSEYEEVPAYKLPTDEAILVVNVEEYFQKYAILNQA